MSARNFTTTLGGDQGPHVIEVPFDVEKVFGQKRAPVKGTVNGTPFRGRVAVYGGKYYLGFNKEIRDQARIVEGDSVSIELDVDNDPRTVTVPQDLAAALSKRKELEAFFEGLAYTHRREYVKWIEEAKKPDTRDRRVAKTLELLEEKIRHP